MKIKLQKVSTSLTIGTFLIAAITGVLIFLEIGPGSVRATHEWISIVFVVASFMHIYSHQKSFVKYFFDKYLSFIFIGIVLGGILFTISFKDVYSADAAFDKITNSKIQHLAPIFNVSSQKIVSHLEAADIEIVSEDLTLNQIADLNHVDIYDVIEPLWLIDAN